MAAPRPVVTTTARRHNSSSYEHGRPADRLDTLTREVLITSGRSDVFHAPTGDGGSLCGMRDGDRRDLQHVPLRSVPCRACFSTDVYESFGGPPRER